MEVNKKEIPITINCNAIVPTSAKNRDIEGAVRYQFGSNYNFGWVPGTLKVEVDPKKDDEADT